MRSASDASATRTRFSATTRLTDRCRARNTVAIAPVPIGTSMSYASLTASLMDSRQDRRRTGRLHELAVAVVDEVPAPGVEPDRAPSRELGREQVAVDVA